jgi:transcriptional regulator with XRE-family HTH domain
MCIVNNNEHKSGFGERFTQERVRTGLSQIDIAEKVGVSRNMIGRYERGIAKPGGEVLISLSELGMDIYYILVGRKENESVPAVLKPDEAALIDTYRSLPDEDKSDISNFATGVAERAVRHGVNKRIRTKPKQDDDPEQEDELENSPPP